MMDGSGFRGCSGFHDLARALLKRVHCLGFYMSPKGTNAEP